MSWSRLDRRDFLLLLLYLASKYIKERLYLNKGKPVVPSRLRVMKLVFLAQKEAADAVYGIVGSLPYNFKPYMHGPFAKEVLDDLEALEKDSLIKIETQPIDIYGMVVQYNYLFTETGIKRVEELIKMLNEDPRASTSLQKLEELMKKHASKTVRKLLDYVYKKYPEDSVPEIEIIEE